MATDEKATVERVHQRIGEKDSPVVLRVPGGPLGPVGDNWRPTRSSPVALVIKPAPAAPVAIASPVPIAPPTEVRIPTPLTRRMKNPTVL
jgi:hypothetical protein